MEKNIKTKELNIPELKAINIFGLEDSICKFVNFSRINSNHWVFKNNF